MPPDAEPQSAAPVIRGRVYVLGDNIDTDQIIPAQYLNLVPTIPEEYAALGSYAMAGLPDTALPFIAAGAQRTPYSLIVAGRNFGCGSSREHAPVALGAAGVRAVVAESYARIFFRNAVATGELYPIESADALEGLFKTGDEAELDLGADRLRNLTSGAAVALKPLGAVRPVVEAGGIFGYARKTGMLGKAQPPAGRGVDTSPPDPPRARRHTTQVVALANQKGGVGKTTTAINLAACLAEARKRVLVIDLDPQCNATSGLGIEPQQGASLYRALLGETPPESLVRETPCAGVDIIPAELDLAGAEVDIARLDRYLHRFRSVLDALLAGELDRAYAYILVDCPPALGILTMNALAAADCILVPMQCEYYALEGLSVIVRLVEQLRASGANPELAIEGILMTMYDARTNLAEQVVREVRGHFGETVYRTVIPRNVRLSEAPSYGRPIIAYAAHSTGAEAYRALAREFNRRMTARTGATRSVS
jgi:chromosome partitioning protein